MLANANILPHYVTIQNDVILVRMNYAGTSEISYERNICLTKSVLIVAHFVQYLKDNIYPECKVFQKIHSPKLCDQQKNSWRPSNLHYVKHQYPLIRSNIIIFNSSRIFNNQSFTFEILCKIKVFHLIWFN